MGEVVLDLHALRFDLFGHLLVYLAFVGHLLVKFFLQGARKLEISFQIAFQTCYKIFFSLSLLLFLTFIDLESMGFGGFL